MRGPGGKTPLNVLTSEQVDYLLKLVNEQKHECMMGAFSPLSWILDTGASNHVTGDLTCLHHLFDLCWHLRLPDGQHVLATKKGQVVLYGDLTLNNVLVVSKLSCNLVSISQLMDEMQPCAIY